MDKIIFKTLHLRSLLITIAVFSLPLSSVSAARFYFDAGRDSILPCDTLEVEVMVDTENQNDNAFEGEMSYSNNLRPIEITSGQSIVTTWLEYPEALSGKIRFSGIVPGGFSGVLDPATKEMKAGILFNIKFEVLENYPAQLSFLRVKAFKNDGFASPDISSSENLQVVISQNATPSFEKNIVDINPPEFFTPKISSHPSVFEGKYFLAFDTIDKGSRIRDFFVKEGIGSWKKAKSPYLLDDQNLLSKIYVKAVDLDGNERIVEIDGKPMDTKKWLIIGLIVAGLIFVAFRQLRKRK